MTMSDDEKKGYVVRDRRRFDAEGEPRTDAAIPKAEVRRVPEPPRPKAPEAGARPQEPARTPSQGPRAEPRQPPPPKQAPLSREPVDFSSLVLSVATNAMMSLQGQSPDGRSVGRPNLGASAQHIDILTMLEEKTRGNLSPEEEDLVKNVLYDLRMHYVEIARQLEAAPKNPKA